MGRPSCAWGFQRTRERFKHLLEDPLKCSDLSRRYFVIPTHPFEKLSAHEVEATAPNPVFLSLIKVEQRSLVSIDDNQFTVMFSDNTGRSITLPKLLPTYYENTVRVGRQKSPVHLNADNIHPKATTFIFNFLKCIEHENFYYNEYLSELIRQETVECYDRGKLLAQIRIFYKNFIESVPIRFSNLCSELFCQEILYQQASLLNEKYINETNRIYEKMKMISESNDVYKSEEKQLETMFKAKLSEASMKEHLLNELKCCYEYQRKMYENRLKDMRDDNELWNNALKVLNYHVFNQLSNVQDSNISNLAAMCFDLQQLIEIWRFIGIWLVQSLKLYDTMIINKIDKLINMDWLSLIESVGKELNVRDQQCQKYLQELDSILKTLNEYQKHDSLSYSQSRLVNAGCYKKNLSESLMNLLRVSNLCLDMFNGEGVLNVEEKLKTIENIQNNLFKLIYQSSHYNELMIDNSPNYEQEVTAELQKELYKIITDYQVHLQGENGIVQLLSKFIRNIKDFSQRKQFNIEEYTDVDKISNSDNQMDISHKEELNNQEFMQYYNFWIETVKKLFSCIGQTSNYELSLKETDTSKSVSDEHVISEDISQDISDSYEHDPTVNYVDFQFSKCYQNIVKWFELMKNRVTSVSEMRINQLNIEQVNATLELNTFITNNSTNDMNNEQNTRNKNNSSILNNKLEEECKVEKDTFYELTKKLYELGKPIIRQLIQENNEFSDRQEISSRLEFFQLCAQKRIKLLNNIKAAFNVRETFKHVNKYLNRSSTSIKFAGISDQSIIRYLQSTDWTIRESLLADTHDNSPVQDVNITESISYLSKNLTETNLASAALLKQNEYHEIILKIENETIECEKETVIIEQKWKNMCTIAECLQNQLDMKRDEVKQLEKMLQVKMEVFD
ncbi:unnamed protein product [Heterobilharzia americana]|nr:unnamed protein product [Heterobilharzia americana]